jgi:hypothetical protein
MLTSLLASLIVANEVMICKGAIEKDGNGRRVENKRGYISRGNGHPL